MGLSFLMEFTLALSHHTSVLASEVAQFAPLKDEVPFAPFPLDLLMI